MPTKLCLEPRCPEPAGYRGRCSLHSKDHNRATHSSPGRIYSSKRWLMTRRRQLHRHPVCQHPGCSAIATDVDHIVPIQQGGDKWSEDNLQSLCRSHHSAKTHAEVFGGKGRVGA